MDDCKVDFEVDLLGGVVSWAVVVAVSEEFSTATDELTATIKRRAAKIQRASISNRFRIV